MAFWRFWLKQKPPPSQTVPVHLFPFKPTTIPLQKANGLGKVLIKRISGGKTGSCNHCKRPTKHIAESEKQLRGHKIRVATCYDEICYSKSAQYMRRMAEDERRFEEQSFWKNSYCG